MDTYRVDITSILDDLGASVEVSDTLPLTSLDVHDEHFEFRSPVRFEVTLTNGGSGIIASGTVVADAMATCARCLVEFPLTIQADVEGYYVEPGDTEDIPEEQEYGEIDVHGHVDILPAVMSALILEAPFAPLHAEDCAGLCPTCGTDLNTEACSCADVSDAENPFAALGTLFKEEPGDD